MFRAFRSADVVRAETPLLDEGIPLMDRAAHALATTVLAELDARSHRVPGSRVLVLAGGGNNGGDALYAGAILARRGLDVAVLATGTLHEGGARAARRSGARLTELGTEPDWERVADLASSCGVWIDGLLGIGAKPPLRETMGRLVSLLAREAASSPVEPIVVAVDAPTGIDVDTGEASGPVLPATVTVTMGEAKAGLLLPPACHAAGRVDVADIGLTLADEPAVARLDASDVVDLVRVPTATDHKYTRGVVQLGVGSPDYPGAAVLSASGASGAGAGMIRLAASREVASLVLARHPEIVGGEGRAQATVLGSGTGPDDLDRLRPLLNRALEDGYPVVLDAGALGLLRDGYEDLPSSVVLTPHPGELSDLLGARGEPMSRDVIEANPTRAARMAAALTGATVLLKSSVDVVAGPDGPIYAQIAPSAWKATAGAGDVLAGLLGGLLAGIGDEIRADGHGRGRPALLAAAASWIHGRAGDSGGPITAQQIADRIPAVIAEVLRG